MTVITIKSKYQIVIPAKLRKEAGLNVGDFLEGSFQKGGIMFKPKVVIDRKHLSHLPKGIQEGLEDIQAGRVSGPFETHEALVKHLKGVVRKYRTKNSS